MIINDPFLETFKGVFNKDNPFSTYLAVFERRSSVEKCLVGQDKIPSMFLIIDTMEFLSQIISLIGTVILPLQINFLKSAVFSISVPV